VFHTPHAERLVAGKPCAMSSLRMMLLSLSTEHLGGREWGGMNKRHQNLQDDHIDRYGKKGRKGEREGGKAYLPRGGEPVPHLFECFLIPLL